LSIYIKSILYYNNYLEKLLRYKLEEKKVFCCEVCGVKKMTERKAAGAAAISVNEFHKDGTIKIHYTCSNHIVDLYNKIIKEIESK
jgi:hypothetical protein